MGESALMYVHENEKYQENFNVSGVNDFADIFLKLFSKNMIRKFAFK